MRRKDRQMTDQKNIDTCIEGCFFTTLVMVDEGRPYAIPINFGYVDGTFYLHSARAGKKVDILKKNGKVPVQLLFVSKAELKDSASADAPACDLSCTYASVIVEGDLEEVYDEEEAMKGMRAMLNIVGKKEKKLAAENLQSILIMKVTVRSMTGKANGA